MANLYTKFDNGTFESFAAPFNTQPNVSSPIATFAVGRTTDDKFQGNASMGYYTGAGATGPSVNPPDFAFRNISFPLVLTPGKKYRITCKVKIDPGAPIGTANKKLGLIVPYSNGVPVTLVGTDLDGGKIYDVGATSFNAAFRTKIATVQNVLDNPWMELFIEWIEPSTGTPGYRVSLNFRISFGNGSSTPAPWKDGPGESIENNGKMWIDKVEVLETVSCDLALGSPSYTKTDETGVGLNDGTATINATSSFTRSYSSDNLTFTTNNVFTALAPGLHTFYVKDTNPAGCSTQVQVQILQFTPAPPPPPPVPGNLDIDAKPVNDNNYVPWFQGSGKITFDTSSISNCCYDIPAAYRIRTKGKNNMRHAIVAVNGEELTFYINFNTPINDPDFSSYRLALVADTGLVQDDIGILSKDLFVDGVTYNIYGSVTLNGVIIDRYYKMVIYNTTTQDIIYVSGLIEVMSLDNAKCLSTRLRYRCTINIYGFRYESVTEFFNIHRLRLYRVDEQEEATLKQYRAVSSGQMRNVNYELDRWIALESYYFDDIAHRATGVFQLHDVVLLNDVAYLLKTPNKRTFDKDKELYKSVIEFYEQGFSTRNRFNRLGNITIITDLLLTDFGSRVKL